MSASTAKGPPALGFLTVIEHADHGHFGGYLVLNGSGRPIEFHCTVPVKTNRAQEILYGPTLRPYLYGEQIGQTLLAKSKCDPLLVFTDVEPVLAVRQFVRVPVLLLPGSQSVAGSLLRFPCGNRDVAAAAGFATDRESALAAWQTLNQPNHLDLDEPFSRIREAIEEAQRSARSPAPPTREAA